MACDGTDACGAVSVAMERTALDLMEYFKARAAYTFSDEITLALLPTLTNPPPFGGKIAKLISIASGTNVARAHPRARHFGSVLTRYCRLCVSSIQPPHQFARVSPARGGMRSLLLARTSATFTTTTGSQCVRVHRLAKRRTEGSLTLTHAHSACPPMKSVWLVHPFSRRCTPLQALTDTTNDTTGKLVVAQCRLYAQQCEQSGPGVLFGAPAGPEEQRGGAAAAPTRTQRRVERLPRPLQARHPHQEATRREAGDQSTDKVRPRLCSARVCGRSP